MLEHHTNVRATACNSSLYHLGHHGSRTEHRPPITTVREHKNEHKKGGHAHWFMPHTRTLKRKRTRAIVRAAVTVDSLLRRHFGLELHYAQHTANFPVSAWRVIRGLRLIAAADPESIEDNIKNIEEEIEGSGQTSVPTTANATPQSASV